MLGLDKIFELIKSENESKCIDCIQAHGTQVW